MYHGARFYESVIRGWRSFGRRYHTLDHLGACLRELDSAAHLATESAEVELALWGHDVVYRTWRRDNEERSARWLERCLRFDDVAEARIMRMREHILATKHAGTPNGGDARLVVDIDLSILGQSIAVYDAFEANVRREYWWVPRKRYVAARTAVLESFLARPAIYHWPMFRDRYEAAARANLKRALAGLA
jgi:predicted metal-dependent HD superfamily phosphohydrolase